LTFRPPTYRNGWTGELILLGKVWRMRKSETMRAASRLLLSHPIFCLLAVLAALSECTKQNKIRG
jgi:hypothetical protein